MDIVFGDIAALSMLPTLLYTWQYYDMVEAAANKKCTRLGFWIKTMLVTFVGLGNLIATGFSDYYAASFLWHLEPEHFDIEL